ncbi:MAG: hypothetical protein M1829_002918, partial [Trizodia sp. TS-e1964]
NGPGHRPMAWAADRWPRPVAVGLGQLSMFQSPNGLASGRWSRPTVTGLGHRPLAISTVGPEQIQS